LEKIVFTGFEIGISALVDKTSGSLDGLCSSLVNVRYLIEGVWLLSSHEMVSCGMEVLLEIIFIFHPLIIY
jgi:hypothetical protein